LELLAVELAVTLTAKNPVLATSLAVAFFLGVGLLRA